MVSRTQWSGSLHYGIIFLSLELLARSFSIEKHLHRGFESITVRVCGRRKYSAPYSPRNVRFQYRSLGGASRGIKYLCSVQCSAIGERNNKWESVIRNLASASLYYRDICPSFNASENRNRFDSTYPSCSELPNAIVMMRDVIRR